MVILTVAFTTEVIMTEAIAVEVILTKAIAIVNFKLRRETQLFLTKLVLF